ncbi:MAG: C4-type zinc ribbon domain-containing protein [Vicinamibacterales bacterium]
MIPALAALVALQKLDSAADTARRRLAEMPDAEAAMAGRIAEAEAAVTAIQARLAENQQARRGLEKDVAGVEARMSRFNDHKAAVKTNQEYTALLHEIETAKAEKDGYEEKILELMEAADGITAELEAARAAVADAKKAGDAGRAEMKKEAAALEEELARIAAARKGETADIEPPALARYEQLLKGRKGVAVAALTGETCSACFVRLRPHVTQMIRRNDSLIECENCQRILYYEPPAEPPS